MIFVKTKEQAYSWLDANIKKSFLDNKIHLSLVARNLLDINRVTSNRIQGGNLHSSSVASSMLLGYGRSNFLKLLYNLNF